MSQPTARPNNVSTGRPLANFGSTNIRADPVTPNIIFSRGFNQPASFPQRLQQATQNTTTTNESDQDEHSSGEQATPTNITSSVRGGRAMTGAGGGRGRGRGGSTTNRSRQARDRSHVSDGEDSEDNTNPASRPTPSRRPQQQPVQRSTSAATVNSNLPNIEEPEEIQQPRIVCNDGQIRSKTGSVWEPVTQLKVTDDMTLVKSYMSNRVIQFGKLTGRKRGREETENCNLQDITSRELSLRAESDGYGSDCSIDQGEAPHINMNTIPFGDSETCTEMRFNEEDIINAITSDPYNLVLTGNVGMREVLTPDTPLNKVYNLLVSSSSGIPEPTYCRLVADAFNATVLHKHNREMLQSNVEYIKKVEQGITCLQENPRYVSLDGTKQNTIPVYLDRNQKIPLHIKKAILKENLGLSWTAEQVQAQREANLNPHLDMENMAKRYKILSKMLYDEIVYVNTDECYQDGSVMRSLNQKKLMSMMKCDEMYQKIIGWKGLSVFANRTTAMNMGVRAFSSLTIDTDSNELVEETYQHVGGRNNTSARKVVSQQSLTHNSGSSHIGETSTSGKKMSSITANTSNAQKRRRIGVIPSKAGGFARGANIGGRRGNAALTQFT